uniref:Uncharacterized protein n=1 Tax=Anguilla anguilla TaxID=7936 RepID=A0A0E9TS74_ANGAN
MTSSVISHLRALLLRKLRHNAIYVTTYTESRTFCGSVSASVEISALDKPLF